MNQLATTARAMVDHVRVLKRLHASGESPRFGDVEELFNLAERLHVEIQLNEPALPCSMACNRPSTERVAGRPYCSRCARALTALQTQVQDEAPEIARTRLEAMLQGRVAWPTGVAEAMQS